MSDFAKSQQDYVTDGKIGIDLTATYASASAGSTTYFPVTPNTVVTASNNGKYMFVRAQSDISQFDVVIMSTFADSAASATVVRAVPITTTMVTTTVGPQQIGFAQTSIASGTYGWVALNGDNLQINVLVSCQPKVPLFTTSTAGKLDDATVSSCLVSGVVINTSATSASAPLAFVNNPHIQWGNPV